MTGGQDAPPTHRPWVLEGTAVACCADRRRRVPARIYLDEHASALRWPFCKLAPAWVRRKFKRALNFSIRAGDRLAKAGRGLEYPFAAYRCVQTQ